MQVRPTRLTIKERKYIRKRAESGFDPSKKVKIQDARNAGFSNPYQAVQRIEDSPRVQSIVQREMNSQGLTLSYTVKKHKEAMECTLPTNPRYPDHPEQSDNFVRFQATKESYKLHEAYADPKLIIDKTERHFNVSIEAYRRAEEVTGEKIIDVIPEEEAGEDEGVGFVESL